MQILCRLPSAWLRRAAAMTAPRPRDSAVGATFGIGLSRYRPLGRHRSLGAFNAIVVENLVPDANAKPEVYIAGSSGIVRFDSP